MLPRSLLRILLFLSALALPEAAVALNVVSLGPTRSAAPGDRLQLTLAMQFEDPTLGGGLEIRLDPTFLAFERFVFDPALGDDPALRLGPADGSTSSSLIVAFGALDGLGGSRVIGELHLLRTAWSPPSFGWPLDVDPVQNAAPAGPFVSALDFQPLSIEWVGTTVLLVPEPGAAALVGLGLVALAVRRPRAGAGA